VGGFDKRDVELRAARVAAGAGVLPEFADRRVRYLQVTVTAEPNEDIKVMTAGATIKFDASGRLTEAGPLAQDDVQISRFEHDACVQLALRDVPATGVTYH
jgi:hypothetical protein